MIYYISYEVEIKLYFSPCGCPVDIALNILKAILTPQFYNTSFILNWIVLVCMELFLGAFNLFYWSICLSLHQFQHIRYTDKQHSNSTNNDIQERLGYSWPRCILMKIVKKFLSSSTKITKNVGGIALNLLIWELAFINIIFNLSIDSKKFLFFFFYLHMGNLFNNIKWALLSEIHNL